MESRTTGTSPASAGGHWLPSTHARFLAEISEPDHKLIDTPAEDLPVWAKETVSGGKVSVFRHGGGLPGSQGDADCRSDGVTFVAIFNCKFSGLDKPNNALTYEGATYPDHRPMWHDIAGSIEPGDWPKRLDLFPQVLSAQGNFGARPVPP